MAPPAMARLSPDRPIQTIGRPIAAMIDETKMFDKRLDATGQIWVTQGSCRKNPSAVKSDTLPTKTMSQRASLYIFTSLNDFQSLEFGIRLLYDNFYLFY
jgi:hypothetical protein